jgi:hypothetical protein
MDEIRTQYVLLHGNDKQKLFTQLSAPKAIVTSIYVPHNNASSVRSY